MADGPPSIIGRGRTDDPDTRDGPAGMNGPEPPSETTSASAVPDRAGLTAERSRTAKDEAERARGEMQRVAGEVAEVEARVAVTLRRAAATAEEGGRPADARRLRTKATEAETFARHEKAAAVRDAPRAGRADPTGTG